MNPQQIKPAAVSLVQRFNRVRRRPEDRLVCGERPAVRLREVFDEMIWQNAFIEHAAYVGHSYGTPRKYVEDALHEGKNVLLEIDVQGALQIRNQYPSCVLIFIVPPSMEELRRRLTGRGSESSEVINRRMTRAKEEAGWMTEYYYILVNEDVDQCAARMDMICKGLSCKTENCRDLIEELMSQAALL